MNTSKTRLTLLGIAFGILLALLLAPQTRWLVRLQTLALLHQYHPLGCASYSASPADDAQQVNATAGRQTNDFAFQYAVAAESADGQALLNLRALTQRFPNSPILWANLLRYESLKTLSKRSGGYTLMDKSTPSYVSQALASSPEVLAAYDREAASGERTDPENAYFPFMRAYGLLAAHRDAEAVAAVQRASVKPRWNEYLTENVEAQWRLHTKAFGDPGAMPQSAIFSNELLPQYSRLRDATRIIIYLAVLKEQAGHLEDGFALREALRRCGDLMRVQSTTLIGSLVGVAISSIAERYPGGIMPPKRSRDEQSEQARQQRVDAYCAYVTQIGHPDAARLARAEEVAQRKVQGLANPDDSLPDLTDPILHLTFWWMTGLTLLLNTAWLLVLGLLAAGRARRSLAPKPPIGWKAVLVQWVLAFSLWVSLALLFVCVSGIWITVVYHAGIDWGMTFGMAAALILVVGLIMRVLHRMSLPQRKGVFKTAALLPVLLGIVYGLFWLMQWVAWPLAELPQGLRLLTGISRGTNDSDRDVLQTQTLWICAAMMLILPLLLALVLSVFALVRHTSVFSALAVGFKQFAVPIACLLMIVYGGVLLGTLHQERRVSAFNQQIVSEGGRYFAARAGQTWPGPVQ